MPLHNQLRHWFSFWFLDYELISRGMATEILDWRIHTSIQTGIHAIPTHTKASSIRVDLHL